MKLSKWKIEYTITLIIVFTLFMILCPISFQNTVQANYIKKWQDSFDKLQYALDAILKQEQSDILTSLKKADSPERREQIILQIIKPYVRLKDTKVPRRYRVKYLNKTLVTKNDTFAADEYYFTENNKIVGIKDTPNGRNGETLFIMTVDVNGILPPNTWGKDVFGAKVYSNKVEPLGRELTLEEQFSDCAALGSGISCSNYYLIGGNIND